MSFLVGDKLMEDHISLVYEDYGDTAGTPLIILHGFFASSRNWRQIAKRFADYYHVYVLDMRNHGLSPHAENMDYSLMAADLKYFMDVHQLQTANILGHSMGGKVAMWFALNNPERVEKLLIVDISPVCYQHSFDQTINALIQLPLEEITNRKQADEFLSAFIPELSYRQFLLQNLQLKEGQYRWRIDLDVFYRTADNIIAFPEFKGIEPYKGAVLFMMGGNSTYLDRQAIMECFPKAEIVIIKEASHWLHIDKPAEFLDAVLGFL